MATTELRMLGFSVRSGIVLLVTAMTLSGCAQFERNQPVASTQDDDSYCRASGAAAGSKEYIECRKNRDAATARSEGSNSRIERAHRNLAEDMLNNKR